MPEHSLGKTATLQDGSETVDHWFRLPLDYSDPDGEKIDVFAREYRKPGNADKPWLLYLQGGPGGKGSRFAGLSGWAGEAAKRYRILMLDQRGTGLSSPITRQTLPQRGTPEQQLEYLLQFRAPNIVRDAEQIRQLLGSQPWMTLGQSYGGFCTVTYLSFFPEGLAGSMITGGLPPVAGPADQVYQATYDLMRARNREYFERYPHDWTVLESIVEVVRNSEVRLPDGSVLTVGRVQMMGMELGGNGRIDQLHYLLQEAFVPGTTVLSDVFLTSMLNHVHRATNPLYLVMHESIYAQPGAEPTDWAAARVLVDHPDFDPERTATPLLTGEMVFPWYTQLDPTLEPLAEVTDLLARHTGFDALYDSDQLSRNTVPVAAAVFRDDVYVARELSLKTADQIRGIRVWDTADYHHDGLGVDGARIFKKLHTMITDHSTRS